MELYKKIDLKSISLLPKLVEDYIYQNDKTTGLTEFKPNFNEIEKVIELKKQFPYRNELFNALTNQYKNFSISPIAINNLNLLKQSQTFTICTAHQLCLFTGPSYFIFKILSAIKMAKILKEKYPNYNFVPVYWMGSEDHDFEEINHLYIYDKKIEWQNNEQGAVGRMSLNGIDKTITQLEEILGNSENERLFISELKTYFTNKEINYSKAFQEWIMHLFKNYGLLAINQDDKELKRLFTPIMKQDIENNTSANAINYTLQYLNKNYHVQASPRDINLFYFNKTTRERIEISDKGFQLVDSKKQFTKEEILEELNSNPENFSPNVILRPLYQETILPNAIFIGGAGEVSYWLELKEAFNVYNITQPLILLRDMALFIPKKEIQRLNEWHINIENFFDDFDNLAKNLVKQMSENELNLNTEKEELLKLFSTIKKKVKIIDKSLEKSVNAEEQKIINSFSNLESKIIRAEKKQYETTLNQLEKIKEKLFPNGVLQERYNNFIPLYMNNWENYFEILLENFDCFNKGILFIKY